MSVSPYFAAAAAALLASTAALAAAAPAPTYTFRTFRAPNAGSTILEAVNNGGSILAQVTTSGSSACSVHQGPASTAIADPNAPSMSTVCLGLGNGNVVVGYYQAPNQPAGASVGFVYRKGAYIDFVVPAASPQMGGTQLNAVSSNGLIAGTYSDAMGFQHVFTTRGSPTALHAYEVAGQHYLLAVGVNNAGSLVLQNFGSNGLSYSGSFYHAAGTQGFVQINYPGSVQDVCHNVNNNGEVACHYADSQGLQHGFIYYGATNTYSANIDAPTSTGGTLLFGINDSGRVVGATTPNPQTSIRLGLIGTPSS